MYTHTYMADISLYIHIYMLTSFHLGSFCPICINHMASPIVSQVYFFFAAVQSLILNQPNYRPIELFCLTAAPDRGPG